MRLGEILRLSWTNIWNHKMRSLLAILGVLIGVGAVIAIVTMTEGLQTAIETTFTHDILRADTISITSEGGFAFFGSTQAFSDRDVEYIKNLKLSTGESPVKVTDVIGRVRGDVLSFEGRRFLDSTVRVITSPDVIPLSGDQKSQPVTGKGQVLVGVGTAASMCERFKEKDFGSFSDKDKEDFAKLAKDKFDEIIKQDCEHVLKDPRKAELLVCAYKKAKQTNASEITDALKKECADSLTRFTPMADRVRGQTLHLKYLAADSTIKEDDLKIVGIVKDTQFIRSDVSYVSVDYHSDTELLDGTERRVYTGLIVSVNKEFINRLKEVKDALDAYFKSPQADARKILGSEKKVEINTLDEIISQIRGEIGKFTAFMGAIAAVALLVGMIGVMNVMLITVKERTREIGVMKATGATNGGVLRLFLSEAILICSIGALVGVFLGVGGSKLVIKAMEAVFEIKDIPFVFVWVWYIVAVIVGMLVGIVSGVYPAWSAARVNPIEALRYE
ncbi:ABC transporter permease [Candidatus Acetothermia bacterium]|nr:ABC transporter permease [Candidatus Acetothermia bacterium]MBI3658992.1 ABC transporter permease [Candidatus Acetothermia bacterium]